MPTGVVTRSGERTSALLAKVASQDWVRLERAMALGRPVAATTVGMRKDTAAGPIHGGGNGLLTIARGTLPLALFGASGYGLRTGLLAAPARILQGAAPLLFGLVLDRGGPLAALLLTSLLTGGSCLALSLLHPLQVPGAVQGS